MGKIVTLGEIMLRLSTPGNTRFVQSDSFDVVKIGISRNQALFEMENCKIVTRLLDGEFLNYSSVIPKNWETRIRVNKNNIQNCFERISLISSSSIEKEKNTIS